MEKKTYTVIYREEQDENNRKKFKVTTIGGKKSATNKVIEYIEENNIHPSINYGYSLACMSYDSEVDKDAVTIK